jgi:hypothetical protein
MGEQRYKRTESILAQPCIRVHRHACHLHRPIHWLGLRGRDHPRARGPKATQQERRSTSGHMEDYGSRRDRRQPEVTPCERGQFRLEFRGRGFPLPKPPNRLRKKRLGHLLDANIHPSDDCIPIGDLDREPSLGSVTGGKAETATHWFIRYSAPRDKIKGIFFKCNLVHHKIYFFVLTSGQIKTNIAAGSGGIERETKHSYY